MARSRGLPPGSYGHLEANSRFATSFGREEDFEGGLCYVMIVRYSDTPVGKRPSVGHVRSVDPKVT
jgi:hypothetical protein